MLKKGILSYSTPLLFAVLIFTSDFLETSLFKFGDLNFAFWFILSTFCFGAGWFMVKSFGYQSAGKMIFAISIGIAIVSVFFVLLFHEYFNASNPTVENIFLFALRNFFLGAMGFFGLAIRELWSMHSTMLMQSEKIKLIEDTIKDSKKESELIIREAQVQASKIINDAETSAKNIFLRKERVEKELRDFIQIEKELIKKYEATK
jgi:NACalpha-BTF3-like transcription factor